MITVDLTNEQYVTVLALLETTRLDHASEMAVASWPDVDFHAATAARLDSTIAAMRAGLARAIENVAASPDAHTCRHGINN